MFLNCGTSLLVVIRMNASLHSNCSQLASTCTSTCLFSGKKKLVDRCVWNQIVTKVWQQSFLSAEMMLRAKIHKTPARAYGPHDTLAGSMRPAGRSLPTRLIVTMMEITTINYTARLNSISYLDRQGLCQRQARSILVL